MINQVGRTLFLDLDGTLLSDFKKITKKDLNVLRDFSKAGGEIVISTGKTYENTKKYIKKINSVIQTPIKFCACLNGNIIIDLRGEFENVIYENYISNKDCQLIYHVAKRNHVVFAPYTKNGIVNGNIHITSSSFVFNLINKLNVSKWKIRSLNSYKYMLAYKINLFSRNIFSNRKLQRVYQELINNENIQVLRTRDCFYEIVKKGSNKGYALQLICQALGASVEGSIAIGDSYNDLPMFKVANVSISVRNDGLDFQKACTYIIKSRRNRVSKALAKILYPRKQYM